MRNLNQLLILAKSTVSECGQLQSTNHIVEMVPFTNFKVDYTIAAQC